MRLQKLFTTKSDKVILPGKFNKNVTYRQKAKTELNSMQLRQLNPDTNIHDIKCLSARMNNNDNFDKCAAFLKKKTPFKQNKIKSNEEIHEKNPIIGVNKGTLVTFRLFLPKQLSCF